VHTLTGDELIDALDIQAEHQGLSLNDCSVWLQAKKINATLLTGDGLLRKRARNNNLEVRGILFIMDEIVAKGIVSKPTMANKIALLSQQNSRLPKVELDKRINLWKS